MLGRYGRKVIGVADWAMDPQGWARTPSNELTLADEYDDCGLPFRRWQRTRDFGGGEQAMISKTRAAFADGELFVVERCTNTIRELRTWRWQMDDQQRLDIREKPMLTDNHSCDCIKAWIADEPAFATHYVGVIDTAEDLPPQEQEEIDGDGWQDGMV
jgi:phage terminase large subunit